jgi:hypothetical protein
MTTQPTIRPGRLLNHAPFAGAIVDDDTVLPLAVRFDQVAITADGRLVSIHRPSEWIDEVFHDWHELDISRMKPDQMRSACQIVESMLQLRPGTLSAESLQPSLQVAAACVAGTLYQLRDRLGLWRSPSP